LGIGDWGLGIGGLGPSPKPQNPNPQSPIPNPQSPLNFILLLIQIIISFLKERIKNIKFKN